MNTGDALGYIGFGAVLWGIVEGLLYFSGVSVGSLGHFLILVGVALLVGHQANRDHPPGKGEL